MNIPKNLAIFPLLMLCAGPAMAGSRNSENLLGPTGMVGQPSNKGITITKVEKGSPADGRIRPGDVILGVGKNKFNRDARLKFADAIDEAETTEAGGKLTLILEGNRTVELQLKVMGRYNDTAPYDCPKSDVIIRQAADYLIQPAKAKGKTPQFNAGKGQLQTGWLGLMATGEPKYIDFVKQNLPLQDWTKPNRDELMAKVKGDEPTSYVGWFWGYVREHAESHKDRPFFMYVAYTAAHWPMHALERDIAKYKGRYDAGYEAIREARYKRMKELGVIGDWNLSKGDAAWKGVDESTRAWELRCMEVYAAMVDSMDRGIGRIVESLKATGQFENTLILYLQDNGGCAEAYGRKPPKRPLPDDIVPMGKDELQTAMIPQRSRDGRPVRTGPDAMPGPADTYIAYGRNWVNVSNTPFREYKSSNHECGIATPLIAHWPKGIAARNEPRHEPGHLIDIMATCIELSGAQYPARFADHEILPMEGRSLTGGFADDRKEERTLLFEHYGRAAIRKGSWKLVRAGDTQPWELYAIEEDRAELNNLSKKHPEKVRELSALWEKEAERTYIHPKPTGKKNR